MPGSVTIPDVQVGSDTVGSEIEVVAVSRASAKNACVTDPVLMKIFRIIEQDEPSHWTPYEGWLRTHGQRDPNRWERLIDSFIALPTFLMALSSFSVPVVIIPAEDKDDPPQQLKSIGTGPWQLVESVPGSYVKRMIVGAPYDKKIEFVTTREREAA